MAVKIRNPLLYGAEPKTQSTGHTTVATTVITTAAITTTTNAYGYATTTQADNVAAVCAANRTLLNALVASLVAAEIIGA